MVQDPKWNYEAAKKRVEDGTASDDDRHRVKFYKPPTKATAAKVEDKPAEVHKK